MSHKKLEVISQGARAAQILNNARSATVIGATSRGIYLHLGERQIIYLSFEICRGPLTINLIGDLQILGRIKPEMQVQIAAGSLSFIQPGIHLSFNRIPIWQGVAQPTKLLSAAERRAQLLALIMGVLARNHGDRKSRLLQVTHDHLISNPGAIESERLIPMLEKLSAALQFKDVYHACSALQGFLGNGPGLTPSGDDFVMGLVLALNRWSQVVDFPVQQLNPIIVEVSYQKTTDLSANLIECAAQGLADERLLLALDGILMGETDLGMCVTHLVSWGSTSGADALAGMAMALWGDSNN